MVTVLMVVVPALYWWGWGCPGGSGGSSDHDFDPAGDTGCGGAHPLPRHISNNDRGSWAFGPRSLPPDVSTHMAVPAQRLSSRWELRASLFQHIVVVILISTSWWMRRSPGTVIRNQRALPHELWQQFVKFKLTWTCMGPGSNARPRAHMAPTMPLLLDVTYFAPPS